MCVYLCTCAHARVCVCVVYFETGSNSDACRVHKTFFPVTVLFFFFLIFPVAVPWQFQGKLNLNMLF